MKWTSMHRSRVWLQCITHNSFWNIKLMAFHCVHVFNKYVHYTYPLNFQLTFRCLFSRLGCTFDICTETVTETALNHHGNWKRIVLPGVCAYCYCLTVAKTWLHFSWNIIWTLVSYNIKCHFCFVSIENIFHIKIQFLDKHLITTLIILETTYIQHRTIRDNQVKRMN